MSTDVKMKLVPEKVTPEQYDAMKVLAECMLSAVNKLDVGLIYECGVLAAEADTWLPMTAAPRDGTPVLLLGAVAAQGRCDWMPGLQFVGRHVSDSMAWCFAAPVGMGGIPDEWLAGWMPLPAVAVAEVSHG